MIRRRSRRRGYAMVVVVLFVTLMLGLWSIATREIGAMLRIEQARANRVERVGKALPAKKALATALAALRAGYPTPGTYGVTVRSDADPEAPHHFLVTFALDANPIEVSSVEWTILVEPASEGYFPKLDPSTFSTTYP